MSTHPENAPKREVLPVLALLLVQVIFGFNFAASKTILAHFHPLFWSGFRLLIASIPMFLTAFWLVPSEKRSLNWDFFKKVLIYGFIGITLNQAFFLIGLSSTTTTNSAILNSLTPIFTLCFAILWGTEKLTKLRAFGFCLAVMGAVVIRRLEDFSMTSATFVGDLFTIMNCMVLALFFVSSRDFLRKNSPFWVTAWMFLFGSIELMSYSAISSHGTSFAEAWAVPMDLKLGGAMFYNIFLATMLTYFLNSWTLTKVKPSSVALFIYFQPIIAIGNAWINGGETPTTRVLVAIALIFGGVGIGVIKKS